MSASLVGVAAGVAGVGCAVAGGVFFAFSTFVMPAIGRLPAPDAIRVMRAINVAAVTPPFMVILFGSAGVAVVAAVAALVTRAGGAGWVALGAALSLIGVAGLTVVVHVPLNDRLALLDPQATDAATVWAAFLGTWSRWNTVRTVAGIVSAVALLIGAARS